jgi:hypothetical protein
VGIYVFGQFTTYTSHSANFFLTGFAYPLLATKMPEQLAPPLWAKSRYLLQAGLLAGFAASLAMASDSEAMRLIAYLL